MKNPVTPAGIEPATFQFVAQHLNHCATTVLNKKRNINPHNGRKVEINRKMLFQRVFCPYKLFSSPFPDIYLRKYSNFISETEGEH